MARLALGAIFALTLLTALLRTLYVGGTDDAFITFVFARHLAEGQGIVWVPGEEPVWGSSTLLFTLLLALAGAAGAAIPTAAAVIGAAGWGVANMLLARAVAAVCRPSVGFAAGILAAITIQPVELSMGMETGLYVALALTAGTAYAANRPALASILAYLAYLTRPDGLLMLALMLGHALLTGLADRLAGTGRVDPRLLLRLALPCLVLVLVTALATLAYFGDVVPNSARAKIAFGPDVSERFGIAPFMSMFLLLGNRFLADPAVPLYQAGIVIAWIAGLSWIAVNFRRREGTVLVFGTANLVLYQLAQMPASVWYYAPTMQGAFGLLAVGLFAIAVALRRRLPLPAAAVAPVALGATALVLFTLNTVNTVRRDPWGRAFNAPDTTHPHNDLRVVTAALEALLTASGRPAPSILAFEVGQIAWFTRGAVRDVLGLVSPEAMTAAPAERSLYLLQRYRPDYAALVDHPLYPPTATVLQSPAFQASYRPIFAKRRSGGDNYLLFARRPMDLTLVRSLRLDLAAGGRTDLPLGVEPLRSGLLCFDVTSGATATIALHRPDGVRYLQAVAGGPRPVCLELEADRPPPPITLELPAAPGLAVGEMRLYDRTVRASADHTT